MLEIAYVRNHPDDVVYRLKKRGIDAQETVSAMLAIDQKRRENQLALDQLNAESKQLAKTIGGLFKEGKKEEAEQKKQRTAEIKQESQHLQEESRRIKEQLTHHLYQLPNLPHESVPAGHSDTDNELVADHTFAVELHDKAVPHWELAARYQLIDFEAGNKVTGAGFPFYRGQGARLQRALKSFFLDEAEAAGYTEYQPPLLVNEATGAGTGQLPDKEGQMYHAEKDDLYLIPTAEVPLTNLYRDEMVSAAELPIRMCGYTPCFRREAGSYGKDVRGLNRLHQFDKVEIVQIAHPDESYRILDEMVAYVSGLLQKLNLPFRIMRLCGGDLGFAAALTYDFEVWSAAQERYLEVSSVSNFETFQANRMKLRVKDQEGQRFLAHTLNGSAMAFPRILAALLENGQSPEGIHVPEVLRPYAGFDYVH